MAEALAMNAAGLLLAALLCWAISLRLGKVSFVDAVWGGAMAALAGASYWQAPAPGPLALLILAMTCVWGLRLAVHLLRRFMRNGEDPRYVRILAADRAKGRFALAVLLKVWLLQAFLIFAVCCAAQLGILGSAPGQSIGALGWAGFVMWVIGMGFEVVGDAQLARFKADPAHRGRVMDRGLWRFTRHPNYFGDACLWWGIWLACADAGWGLALAALPGLAFLTFTLVKWSGTVMTEQAMAQKYGAEFADYASRTPRFLPWFPKG